MKINSIGTVEVTAYIGEVEASITLTTYPPTVHSVRLELGNSNLVVGGYNIARISAFDKNGREVDTVDRDISLSTNSPNILVLEDIRVTHTTRPGSRYILIRTLDIGIATIYTIVDGVSSTREVSINYIPVSNIEMSQSLMSPMSRSEVTFRVYLKGEDGAALRSDHLGGRKIHWSIKNISGLPIFERNVSTNEMTQRIYIATPGTFEVRVRFEELEIVRRITVTN
jgi:hypothetical protein